ncbi:MAG: oligoribonuclease [Actinomycetota bacterium]
MKADLLIWIDCEMTGLDVEKDCLVEVAALVTDSELNILDDGFEVVIKPREDSLAGMSDFVRDMHTESGLIELLETGVALEEAESALLDYIRKFSPEQKSAPLAGNSIGTDRMFLNRYMPAIDAHLHYRNVDVSSIKELVRRWYPKVYYQLPKKTGGHRALADIRESIAELVYYRESVFAKQPGPSTDEAKQIALGL